VAKSILHIAPTPFFSDRGCHIRIEGIVRCLSQLGHSNVVCTYHHGRDIEGVATKRISPIQNYTQTEAGPSKYKLWADWKLLWLSVKHYRELKPDVIHAHLHEGLLIGIIIKILFFWRRTALIGDMQGSLSGELESHGSFKKLPILRWPVRFLEQILMWLADYIVCSSKHSMQKIQSEFSIADSKISLAQDGADAAKPIDERQSQELKATLALPKNKSIALYSGALINSKGLNELKALILASSKNSAEQSDIHFLIIGFPVDDLESFINVNHLQNCTLVGRVQFEELPLYLSLADIAIDPKRSDAGEGSGKMLNYLAAGLPVVAFDTENNREFLPSGTRLAKDSNELLQILIDVICQHDSNEAISGIDQMARANLEYFEQNYSWQVTKDQLKSAYLTLRA